MSSQLYLAILLPLKFIVCCAPGSPPPPKPAAWCLWHSFITFESSDIHFSSYQSPVNTSPTAAGPSTTASLSFSSFLCSVKTVIHNLVTSHHSPFWLTHTVPSAINPGSACCGHITLNVLGISLKVSPLKAPCIIQEAFLGHSFTTSGFNSSASTVNPGSQGGRKTNSLVYLAR